MTKGSLIESNTHQKIVTESYSWDFKPSSCYSLKRTRSSATHKTELVQCLGLPEVTTHSTYYLLEPPPKSTSPEAPPTTSVRSQPHDIQSLKKLRKSLINPRGSFRSCLTGPRLCFLYRGCISGNEEIIEVTAWLCPQVMSAALYPHCEQIINLKCFSC